jgi:Ca2+-dependent lipid-binding protein
MRQGILTINCQKATLKKDHDIFGKMDPFVKFVVGNQEKRTKVMEEAGLNPVWDQIITFEINNGEEIVELEVRDDDGGSSDLCGIGSFDFGPLVANPDKTRNFTIYLTESGSEAGTLYLEAAFKCIHGMPLKLLIKKAEMNEDHDIFGKMDPFVIVKVGVQEKRTTIKEEAGKTPVWNE